VWLVQSYAQENDKTMWGSFQKTSLTVQLRNNQWQTQQTSCDAHVLIATAFVTLGLIVIPEISNPKAYACKIAEEAEQ